MKNKIKQLIPYLIVVLAIIGPWFLHFGYLFFSDFVTGPNFFKINNWWSGFFYSDFILKGLSFVLPVDFLQKIFIGLIILLLLLSGKKIAEQFIVNKWLVFALSLFMAFNPFVYDRFLYGQAGVVLGLGFFGLFVGNLLQYILNIKDSDNIKKFQVDWILIRASIFAGLAILYDAHFIFFILVLLLVFLAVLLANKQFFNKKLILNAIIGAGIIILINFNWLFASVAGFSSVGNFVTNAISNQDLIAFQTAGKTSAEAIVNVLMMSGFWGKDQYRYVDLTSFKTNWGYSFFLLLPLILYGIYKGLKSKDKKIKWLTGSLLIVFVSAAFLAVGMRTEPTRAVTLWLFNHLPFYKGLRETQKWVAIEVIVYLIFLSWGAKKFFQNKFVIKYQGVIKIFLAAVIIMQAPLLLWGFGGQVRPTKYPDDWSLADQQITAVSHCQGKILFLPWHQYMSFNWIGNIVANPAPAFFTCPVLSGTNMEWGGIYDNSQNVAGQEIENWLSAQSPADSLKSNLNIRYIILAKEIDWKNYSWLGQNFDLQLIQDSNNLMVYKIR